MRRMTAILLVIIIAAWAQAFGITLLEHKKGNQRLQLQIRPWTAPTSVEDADYKKIENLACKYAIIRWNQKGQITRVWEYTGKLQEAMDAFADLTDKELGDKTEKFALGKTAIKNGKVEKLKKETP